MSRKKNPLRQWGWGWGWGPRDGPAETVAVAAKREVHIYTHIHIYSHINILTYTYSADYIPLITPLSNILRKKFLKCIFLLYPLTHIQLHPHHTP